MGALLAVLGVLGFSFKAILIKLAYRTAPVDPVALLTLRMLYSAPFFIAIAWWSGRAPGTAPIGWRDARLLAGLGFIGYYLSSLLDFLGLQYVTASLERLMLFLYPTIVVVLSAIFLAQPITRRTVAALALSYSGIAIAVAHDIRFTGDAHAIALGATLVFSSAVGYAIYLVAAGGIIARLGFLIAQSRGDIAVLRREPRLPAANTGQLVGAGILTVLGCHGAIVGRDLPVLDGLRPVVRSLSPPRGQPGAFASGILAFSGRQVHLGPVDVARRVVARLGLAIALLRLSVAHVGGEVTVAPFEVAIARLGEGVIAIIRSTRVLIWKSHIAHQ